MPERTAIWSREHDRFQVFDGGDVYLCRDWLRRGERAWPKPRGDRAAAAEPALAAVPRLMARLRELTRKYSA